MNAIYRGFASLLVICFMSQSVAFAMNPTAASVNSIEGQIAMEKMTRLVDRHLDKLNQEQKEKFAYVTYKLAVKTRNLLASMSEKKFAKRIKEVSAKIIRGDSIEANGSEVMTQDEAEVVEIFGTETEVSEAQKLTAANNVSSLSQAGTLNKIEAVLNSVGVEYKENGQMRALSKTEFLKRATKLEFRSPASEFNLAPLIYTLLVVALVGVAVLGVFAVIAMGPVGLVVVGVVVVGFVVWQVIRLDNMWSRR